MQLIGMSSEKNNQLAAYKPTGQNKVGQNIHQNLQTVNRM